MNATPLYGYYRDICHGLIYCFALRNTFAYASDAGIDNYPPLKSINIA